MSTGRTKPLLSICVPTYNRARLLRLLLQSLLPQVEQFGGEVEIVVSDNCSTDSTPEVINSLAKSKLIRCYRQSENVGCTRNVLALTRHYAVGEFAWILGDDDMVVSGKLGEVVQAIRENQDLNYFFVNYFFKSIEDRDRIISESDSYCVPEDRECMCADRFQRQVPRWEELLDIENLSPPAMFTAIVCHIFRRSMWNERIRLLRLGSDHQKGLFRSLDETFFHIKILAYMMVGRPAYYVGEPCILMGQGSQEWSARWPEIFALRLGEVISLYEQLKVDLRITRRLRHLYFESSSPFVARVGLDSAGPNGGVAFLLMFAWLNRKHPLQVTRIVAPVLREMVVRRLPRCIYYPLRWLKRLIVPSPRER